jgi:clan AA aspartic protease
MKQMGLTYANIVLSNPRKPNLKSIEAKALVDSGAAMLCIPNHYKLQLELEEEPNSNREVSTADGKTHKVPYVGPIKVQWEGRICYVGALVLGDEPLLGAVPMEDMDLVLHPLSQKLMANPMSPNFPHHKVK